MKTYPWAHDRRYNAYSNHMKKLHGKRVQKVSIDAGFTCPNRDGSVAFGGAEIKAPESSLLSILCDTFMDKTLSCCIIAPIAKIDITKL